MNSKESSVEYIRRQWRELGFYFVQTDSQIILDGSKIGLLQFPEILRTFAKKLDLELDDHEHIGPYMQLQLMDAEQFQISCAEVSGRSEDFIELADLIEQEIKSCIAGECHLVVQADQIDENGEFVLRFHIHEPDFDPSSLDPDNI